PFGYHVGNLAIHLACGGCLFGLVYTTLLLLNRQGVDRQRALNGATLAAAVWLIHPLTTQGVAYICQRYESLAALGYLGAMWLLSRSITTGHVWRYLPGVALFAWAGFLSKETMATAPLVAVLYDWTFGRNSPVRSRTRWPLYAAMLSPLIWFAPSVWRWIGPGAQSGSMGFGFRGVTPWEYLRTQPEILLHYVRLAVWPDALCFDYGWPVQHSLLRVAMGGAVVLVVLGFGLWQLARRKETGWLIVTFFVILAPTSSVVPIADLAVEHRMYLPLAVIVAGIIVGAASLAVRATNGETGSLVGVALGAVGICAVAALVWRTHLRNLDYQSGIRLWSQTLSIRPDNPRAHLFLGFELHDTGEFQESIRAFKSTLARRALVGEVHLGLGDCYRELRQYELAERHYRRSIEIKRKLGGRWADHHMARAHNGLGGIYHHQGRIADSLNEFAQAAELGLPDARYNVADAAERLGRYDEAIASFEQLLSEQPQFTRAARRLAWLLVVHPDAQRRDAPRAKSLIETNFDLQTSTSPYLWDAWAAIQMEQGERESALAAIARAEQLAAAGDDDTYLAEIRDRT
ncbi:MAG: tetratricopeptide repeat protein, partial [Planctomycetaceae bacterium]